MERYDLIVIGAGAGLYLVDAALHKGLRCALIEQGKMGGTCLTRGCIPSKVLVHVADLYREIERSGKVGLAASVSSFDWTFISRRVWAKINQSQQLEESFARADNLDLYKGTARFIDKHRIVVDQPDGRTLPPMTAANIVLAVGGRSAIPPVDGLDACGFLTAESFFGDQYPEQIWKRLVILGGGAIGLEFAHIFSALGVEVTIVEMQDRLAPQEEPEVSELLRKQMELDGVRVMTGTRAFSAQRLSDCKRLHATDPEGRQQLIDCDEILVSTGIRSNSDRLSLDKTDIKTDDKGWVLTDEYLATSQKNIWAIGDINGKYQFRHKANYEAEILAHNLFSGEKTRRKARYDVVPWAIFTHPQIAHVGLTEQQAIDSGHVVLTGRNPYSAVANGYAMGYAEGDPDNGFVKLITDQQHRILGVHIAGPQAAILIQPYVYLMNAGSGCECRKMQLPGSPMTEGRAFRMVRRQRQNTQTAECVDANTTEAIDQSMIIHPSLSEVAGWVTEELNQTGAVSGESQRGKNEVS